ncbi:SDR family NAD(P)-dependent oxidoreductase [Citromicrobium bathyomarinum]|jgi:NAD(P)-dependent dehydrogenase (short-subunit alcohol dehydrogenase family)
MPGSYELKPIARQVVVVTGATSGHGLSTAHMAAFRGARVMIAARNEDALRQVCNDICERGGEADCVVTDVSKEADMQRLTDRTVERFGGFDTWVNNAGIGVYAQVLDLEIEDHRRIFETNYGGVVYGSTIARPVRQDRHRNGRQASRSRPPDC